jgi:hypothetical protein
MKPLVPPALALMLATTACATMSEQAPRAPDYADVPTAAPTPAARLYANCLGQAASSGAFRRTAGGDGAELLLFTCTGAPAAAFFEALGPWSARIGSEFQRDGRTFRSTARVQTDLFGVDYCSAAGNNEAPACVLSFNAGDFLDQ